MFFSVLAAVAAILVCSETGIADHASLHFDTDALRTHINLTGKERQWLSTRPEIRVRVGRWPPFMTTDGQVEGISIDYLDVVAQVHGIRFSYLTEKDMSWPDTLANLASREKVEMVPAIQATPERRSFLNFTTPYQTLPWVIVTRDDAPFVGDMDDLAGRKISVQKRFILERRLREQHPDLELAVVDTPTPTLDSLKEVATGKSFATVNALPIVEYFIRRRGLTNLKVAAPAGFPDLQLSMGIRKDLPELASIIDKTFRAMTHKDKAAIQNAWLSVEYEYGVSYTTVITVSLIGAAGILVIVALFGMINRTLKRQVDERTSDLQKELLNRARIEKALVESLDEKDVLLREIHHRVKNNLQIISGLLYLQETSPDRGDTVEVLRECRNRVQSMALVHKKLYQSENMSDVRLDEYVRALVEQLSRSLSMEHVEFVINADNVPLTIEQAIPCGLIINELVTNALKHAFEADRGNRITVDVHGEDGSITLTVADNGKGFPSDLDVRNPASLGLTLVSNLATQLRGELTITRSPGTAFTLVFPGS